MITFRLVDTCLASSGARYDQPTLTSSSDELSSTTASQSYYYFQSCLIPLEVISKENFIGSESRVVRSFGATASGSRRRSGRGEHCRLPSWLPASTGMPDCGDRLGETKGIDPGQEQLLP